MRNQTNDIETTTDDHTGPSVRRAGREDGGRTRSGRWVIGLAAVGAAALIGPAPSTAEEPVGWDRLDPYYEQYRALLGDEPEIDEPTATPLRADEVLDPHYLGYRARLTDGASCR